MKNRVERTISPVLLLYLFVIIFVGETDKCINKYVCIRMHIFKWDKKRRRKRDEELIKRKLEFQSTLYYNSCELIKCFRCAFLGVVVEV